MTKGLVIRNTLVKGTGDFILFGRIFYSPPKEFWSALMPHPETYSVQIAPIELMKWK